MSSPVALAHSPEGKAAAPENPRGFTTEALTTQRIKELVDKLPQGILEHLAGAKEKPRVVRWLECLYSFRNAQFHLLGDPQMRNIVAQIFCQDQPWVDRYEGYGKWYELVHLLSVSGLHACLDPQELFGQLGQNFMIPRVRVPQEVFSTQSGTQEWMPNDRRSRIRMAKEVVVHLETISTEKETLKIVDFGAGPGLLTREVLALISANSKLANKHITVVCVEPAKSMRETGEAFFKDKNVAVEYVAANLFDESSREALRKNANEADVIMSSFVIGALNLDHPKQQIGELVAFFNDMLSENGKCFITDFSHDPEEHPLDMGLSSETKTYLQLKKHWALRMSGYFGVLHNNVYKWWGHILEHYSCFLDTVLEQIPGSLVTDHPQLFTLYPLYFDEESQECVCVPLLGYHERQVVFGKK